MQRLAHIVAQSTTSPQHSAAGGARHHTRPWSGRTDMTATTWKTDPTHTDVQFSAKHMMVTTVRGKFTDVEGTLSIDEAHPAASSGSFTVRAASLNTGVEQRDGHLRSADFLDAERYPDITFVS